MEGKTKSKDTLKKLYKTVEGSVNLITIYPERYTETIPKLLNILIEDEKMFGIYVSLNKPYKSLVEILKKEKVDASKLLIIDMISGTPEKRTDHKRCIYVDSPQNLTDLSITLSEAISALEERKKFVIIDSLSTFTLYNQDDPVIKFVHFLVTKMQVKNIKLILLTSKGDLSTELISTIAQFADNVTTIKGGES